MRVFVEINGLINPSHINGLIYIWKKILMYVTIGCKVLDITGLIPQFAIHGLISFLDINGYLYLECSDSVFCIGDSHLGNSWFVSVQHKATDIISMAVLLCRDMSVIAVWWIINEFLQWVGEPIIGPLESSHRWVSYSITMVQQRAWLNSSGIERSIAMCVLSKDWSFN